MSCRHKYAFRSCWRLMVSRAWLLLWLVLVLVLRWTASANASIEHVVDSPSASAESEDHGLPWPAQILILLGLLSLSAVFAGLGLGLMSLDLTSLEIVVQAGLDPNATAKEQRNGIAARKIIPLRKRGNLLLTTLLLGNVAVNSITSIFTADITSGTLGFLVSTTLIVLFGEIFPQAICTKYALLIGMRAVPLVKILIVLLYVFSKPVSMVLDASLGEDIGTVFTRRELNKMVEIHEKKKMIDREESDILRGAMTYRSKTVESIMTPVNKLFMLPLATCLNQQTIQKILESGFSRIPIWGDDINDVVGILHIKDLVLVDPKEEVQLSNFIHVFGRSPHRVDPTCDLNELLKIFKTSSIHIALVNSPTTTEENAYFELHGVVTLEDVVEEILQVEILDEGECSNSTEFADRQRRVSDLYADSGRLKLCDLYAEENISNVESLVLHLQSVYPIFCSPAASGKPLSVKEMVGLLSSCSIIEFSECPQTETILSPKNEARFCVVLLDGKLRYCSQDSDRSHTVTPRSAFATESLVLQQGVYFPDFTLSTVPYESARCVCIARTEFQQLLHPFRRRNSLMTNDQM